MPRRTLHIVFSSSAAVNLRRALRRLGRDDNVVASFDDFRVGPIEPLDPSMRETWYGQALGFNMNGVLQRRHGMFWSKALDPEPNRVVWTTRRWASEHVGFLAWAARIGDAAVDVIDLTDVELRADPDRSLLLLSHAALPIMPAAEILSRRLFDLAEPLSTTLRSAAEADWARLAAENAPLRIVRKGRAQSVPTTYFDDALLASSAPQWRKIARVVGEAMMAAVDGEGHDIGDIFLAARVRSLIDDGRLEVKGDPTQMRFSEVRLPRR